MWYFILMSRFQIEFVPLNIHRKRLFPIWRCFEIQMFKQIKFPKNILSRLYLLSTVIKGMDQEFNMNPEPAAEIFVMGFISNKYLISVLHKLYLQGVSLHKCSLWTTLDFDLRLVKFLEKCNFWVFLFVSAQKVKMAAEKDYSPYYCHN